MWLSSLLLIVFVVPILVAFPRLITLWYARNRVYTIERITPHPVAIVFGAGLWKDGSPTPVLRDRVATAVELYMAGKVQKILLSGDNRFVDYNEPAAMRAHAIQLGMPDEDIVLDYAGRRTYDTCYRARHIFGVKEAILVTQDFHLPRALFTCNLLGLPAIGVSADRQDYRRSSLFYWHLRETLATIAALWEVFVSHPLPVLGNPEPIFPTEAE